MENNENIHINQYEKILNDFVGNNKYKEAQKIQEEILCIGLDGILKKYDVDRLQWNTKEPQSFREHDILTFDLYIKIHENMRITLVKQYKDILMYSLMVSDKDPSKICGTEQTLKHFTEIQEEILQCGWYGIIEKYCFMSGTMTNHTMMMFKLYETIYQHMRTRLIKEYEILFKEVK